MEESKLQHGKSRWHFRMAPNRWNQTWCSCSVGTLNWQIYPPSVRHAQETKYTQENCGSDSSVFSLAENLFKTDPGTKANTARECHTDLWATVYSVTLTRWWADGPRNSKHSCKWSITGGKKLKMQYNTNSVCPSREDSQRYKFITLRYRNPAWLWNFKRLDLNSLIHKDRPIKPKTSFSITSRQHLCPWEGW